jgi:hypothetical protein
MPGRSGNTGRPGSFVELDNMDQMDQMDEMDQMDGMDKMDQWEVAGRVSGCSGLGVLPLKGRSFAFTAESRLTHKTLPGNSWMRA